VGETEDDARVDGTVSGGGDGGDDDDDDDKDEDSEDTDGDSGESAQWASQSLLPAIVAPAGLGLGTRQCQKVVSGSSGGQTAGWDGCAQQQQRRCDGR
jgi:hypothetical protein